MYWLLERPVLLAVFALASAMWYLGQRLYFCPSCRVESCPFKRIATRRSAA